MSRGKDAFEWVLEEVKISTNMWRRKLKKNSTSNYSRLARMLTYSSPSAYLQSTRMFIRISIWQDDRAITLTSKINFLTLEDVIKHQDKKNSFVSKCLSQPILTILVSIRTSPCSANTKQSVEKLWVHYTYDSLY